MFTGRQRFILNLGAPLIAAGVKLLSRTCRHEILGMDNIRQVRDLAIVATWHESVPVTAYHYRNTGIHALASSSFDGELAARALGRLGIVSVRGSSSSGGSQALLDLATALDEVGAVLLTLDGPKGPRRVAKPGAAILAARTGASIIPHAFAVSRAWRLRSWDRLSIVKPFARVVSAYAPPISAPANTSRAAVEDTRMEVETSLNQLHQQIETMLGIENGMPVCCPEECAYSAAASSKR
jgi:lysophospholipid acyltransferase (LPLAT)-like uncharacterized protein